MWILIFVIVGLNHHGHEWIDSTFQMKSQCLAAKTALEAGVRLDTKGVDWKHLNAKQDFLACTDNPNTEHQ